MSTCSTRWGRRGVIWITWCACDRPRVYFFCVSDILKVLINDLVIYILDEKDCANRSRIPADIINYVQANGADIRTLCLIFFPRFSPVLQSISLFYGVTGEIDGSFKSSSGSQSSELPSTSSALYPPK